MRLFSLLSSCEGGIEYQKIRCLMYLYQVAGVDLGYKFRFGNTGIVCERLASFIDKCASDGLVSSGYGVVTCKEDLTNYIESKNILDVSSYIKNIGDALTLDNLNYITIVAMVVTTDTTLDKEKVKETVDLLTSGFTDEDFDYAVGIINTLRRLYG